MFSQFEDDNFVFGWWSADPNNPTLEDFTMNGQYCKSGFAFKIPSNGPDPNGIGKAKCDTDLKIYQFDKELASPYECNASTQEPCKIYYPHNTKQKYIEVPCKCSLDGTDRGYCGSIIGTAAYKASRYSLKTLLEGNNCHTYDRDNWDSKMDSCSGKEID